MNINNWSGKRKVFAIFAGILAIVGLIITIFLVQKVQEIRSRAEKATILSLAPTNQNVEAGEEGQLEVVVSPGVNQVNFIKTTVIFDPEKFDFKKDSVKLNSDLGWAFLEGPKVGNGEITFTAAVGSDPTQVISKNTQKLAKITFTVKEDAEDGDSDIVFDVNKTQIRSIGGGDPFTQNVLSSVLGATVSIGAPICRPNIATCSWDASEGATSYHYLITKTNGEAFDTVLEGDTDKTKIEFPSVPGEEYVCTVRAVNECGESDLANGTNTCPTPTPTPTPTPSPSPKPSKSPTPTPIPTEEPEPSEEPVPSEEVIPSPTEVVVITTAPSSPQGGVETTTTPIPTLPPTGNPLVIGGILGGILFVLGGLALLFL